MIFTVIHTCRNLSKRLSSLRERRSSITSSGGNTLQRTHTSSGQQKDGTHPPSGNPLPDAAESLSVEEQLRKRNAYLQGRVDVLQEQNRQLGQCIHELKSFTDMVNSMCTQFSLHNSILSSSNSILYAVVAVILKGIFFVH